MCLLGREEQRDSKYERRTRAVSGEEPPLDLIMEKIPAMQLGVDGADPVPREGATIAIMRMARPAARNALGKNMLQQMRDAIEEVPMDPEIRAVILTSDVERVFCAGADLKERRDMTCLLYTSPSPRD